MRFDWWQRRAFSDEMGTNLRLDSSGSDSETFNNIIYKNCFKQVSSAFNRGRLKRSCSSDFFQV
ncbi:hypothetical protein EJB05_54276 [Eragrostis curvula]|uniref:Uncharacterized protein n=1 Tax=Eragrostis curvula TaxID=38414 RepID=A0A5J9SMQ9_9POAL|nr:hypothetical protein EJB05_54276 [Eragrostis curvula]